MKVGLLTYHRTTNFGSLLQMYALYLTVKELGAECEIIDYHNLAVEKREHPLRLNECRNLKQIYHCLFTDVAKKKKEQNFADFLNKKVHISEESYNKRTVIRCADCYNKILVGSDLVWDFSINGFDTTYMLDFVKESKKKIAYASSAGSIWEEKNKEQVIALLNQFQNIGVREESVSETLESWLNREIDFVCDPTMLIESQQWDALSEDRIIKSDYILCYFSDKDGKIYQDAIRYGKERNIPVYVIAYHRVPRGLKVVHPTRFEEFLSLIKYAHTVFSASYHGLLFSLYFNKNLYYYNRGWKARMESITNYLEIQSREEYNSVMIEQPLDYNRINLKMNEFRCKSKEKLKEYLFN